MQHPKGYAYVEFLEAEAVENALKLENSEVGGRQIKIARKRTNEAGVARGGRGGRGARGRGRGRGGRFPMMPMPMMFDPSMMMCASVSCSFRTLFAMHTFESLMAVDWKACIVLAVRHALPVFV